MDPLMMDIAAAVVGIAGMVYVMRVDRKPRKPDEEPVNLTDALAGRSDPFNATLPHPGRFAPGSRPPNAGTSSQLARLDRAGLSRRALIMHSFPAGCSMLEMDVISARARGCSFREVGSMLRISVDQARRIERRAVDRILNYHKDAQHAGH